MKKLLAVCILVFSFVIIWAQKPISRGDFRIAFYNVENLFDHKKDSLKLDDDFTPEGKYHWTFFKYKTKINKVAQTLLALGEWELPEVVGLCEIENRSVLEDLCKFSPLRKFKYEIVHYESEDKRGIDVALLYQSKKFKLLKSEPIHVNLGKEKTRDILYVKGRALSGDTLHIFINHFPSKYGGILQTLPKREKAAKTLRSKTDSIFYENALSKIILMGDFNDTPKSKSLEALGAKTSWEEPQEKELYNLSAKWSIYSNLGTHKFHGIWSILDQIIVSGGLFKGKGYLFTSAEYGHIFDANFLLEKDKNGGTKPFRTHNGLKYNNGFSDHLPIYLDLWLK